MPVGKGLDESEIAERLAVALSAAQEAGRILLGHLGRLDRYDEKSSINLVTVADRESEAFLGARIRAAFPSDPLLLEEADGLEGARARYPEACAAPLSWCVDPLDGTTNFVHAFPMFAVSIGVLAYGVPVLGVIHAPALGETFAGGLGVPARLNHRPIQVSKTDTLSRALLSTGFPYDRRERIDLLLRVVRAGLMNAHDVRRCGSAALDLAYVATGRTDGFWERGLSPWDVAAGQALIESAGGRVTAFGGGPHDLFGGNVLATNGAIHEALDAMIAAAERP
ncbi:MAG: inositol monophosphatase family protein [Myxococcota bacterium]